MTDPTQIAADRFDQGLNCSQSVLSSFAEQATQGVFHTICPALVRDAVLLVNTILEEDK